MMVEKRGSFKDVLFAGRFDAGAFNKQGMSPEFLIEQAEGISEAKKGKGT